jgi:hypothetical protein
MTRLGMRAYAAVAAVFLLGGAVGAAAMHSVDVASIRQWLGQRSGTALVTKYLAGELKLSEEQTRQLERVIAAHAGEAEAAHRQIYSLLDDIQNRMNGEIRAFLSPEQSRRFDELVAKEKDSLRAQSGISADAGVAP